MIWVDFALPFWSAHAGLSSSSPDYFGKQRKQCKECDRGGDARVESSCDPTANLERYNERGDAREGRNGQRNEGAGDSLQESVGRNSLAEGGGRIIVWYVRESQFRGGMRALIGRGTSLGGGHSGARTISEMRWLTLAAFHVGCNHRGSGPGVAFEEEW